MSISTSTVSPLKKILSEAKLQNITGSTLKRAECRNALHVKFNTLLDDAFEKSDEVSLKDIQKIFKKVIPEINISVKEVEVSSSDRGGITPLFSGDKRSSKLFGWDYEINLGKGKKTINKDDIMRVLALKHENDHLFRALTEQKFNMRFFDYPLSPDASTRANLFYNTNFYTNTANALSIFKKRDNKFKAIVDFILLHNKRLKFKSNFDYRQNTYQNLMEKHFKQNKINDTDSIEILKRCRYSLIDEQSAYNYEAESISNTNPDSAKVIKDYYSDLYDFDAKIGVIEKMFLERVTKVRAGFKDKYGKINSHN